MPTITGDESTGGQIPFFLSNVLSTPAGALPKGAQWVLWFQGDPDYKEVIPVDAIKAGISFEPHTWEIDNALKIALQDDYHKAKGCMFAQAVQIPGEGNQVNTEGIMLNGYIRGSVGAGREAYNGIQIVFLETNVSFVDNVIRPWTIATSHLGMIARSGKLNYRCKISAWKLGVTSPGEPPIILQEYTFYGACPITIDGEEYNYSQTSTAINRNTTFTYYYYKLKSYIDGSFNDARDRTAIPTTTDNNIPFPPFVIPTNITQPNPIPFIIPFNFLTPAINPVILARNKNNRINETVVIQTIDNTSPIEQTNIIPVAIPITTSTPIIAPPDVTALANTPTVIPPDVTALVNTPIITPSSEILTSAQSIITPTINTEQRNDPIITPKVNQIDANTFVKQNIIDAGLPPKEPNTPPIILQQVPRPASSPTNVV